MTTLEDDYPCVGICMVDAETGYCLGCGRPLSVEPLTPAQESVGQISEAGQIPVSEQQKILDRSIG